MHKRVFDQIVIGVGGMGSAALCELARRGQRVLGLEQFGVPHEFGSSAASTRIFRFAYFEHPSYVPLMRLAFARWQRLQRDCGETFMTTTGGLDIGPPSGRVVSGAKLACEAHGLRHEVLRASELGRRFPAWRLPSEFEAVLQPEAGILLADRAIVAHVAVARRLGAEVNENEAVKRWKVIGDRVEVETERARYEAGALILAAGAWTGKLLHPLETLAVPERQVVGWFRSDGQPFQSHNFPVFILDCPEHGSFYGIPEQAEEGYKVGKFHHRYQTVDADSIDRRIGEADVAVLTAIERYLAKPMGGAVGFKTCMFVNSPDEHFIVDALPDTRNVVVAAGFSGHGYKFCTAIGEILADLAMHGTTAHDTALFRLARPALGQRSAPSAAAAAGGVG
ncbi:MAG TPA: N-methyl-L-tryptophan oxidase [Hyphomicrobiaceae bacterium]|jgi:sarcosine oxidase|nr:N-methyl-L-tryptophan oxidase [Hyphomicrobiaceae bacterium]